MPVDIHLHSNGIHLQTRYAQGSLLYGTNTSGFEEAITAAKSADVAIVFVGLHPGQGTPEVIRSFSSPEVFLFFNTQFIFAGGEEAREDEGWDRFNITLPPIQEQLVQVGFPFPCPLFALSYSLLRQFQRQENL